MKVILITKNNFKYEEIKSITNGFGIKLEVVQNENDIDIENQDNEIFLLREQTHLEKSGNKIKTPEHLDVVNHISRLSVTKIKGDKKEKKNMVKK